jgi:hypothetical protein
LRHLESLRSIAAHQPGAAEAGAAVLDRVAAEAKVFMTVADPVMVRLAAAELPADRAAMVSDRLLTIERLWCTLGFDTGRTWFRSGYAAPDQTSGYAAWMLPALRHAIALDDADLLRERAETYIRFYERARELIGEINRLIE